jgi:hypothetical protein
MVGRWKQVVGGPRDVPLFLAIGWFILTSRFRLSRRDVRAFVRALRTGRRPLGSQQTVMRMCSYWLWRAFRNCNTCYMRSITLYRFLDAPSSRLGLHMGIEQRANPAERLRSHAWVTLDGSVIYGPPVAYEGRLREIPLEAVS